jgi:Sugar phosphate isomerases/epimerases
MKLSITMISFEDDARTGKMTVEDFISAAAKLGVDAVDLLEYFWKDKQNEIISIPRILKKYNLKLASFCVGNNFLKKSLIEWHEQIDYVKEGLATAQKLGTNKLRIFGGTGSFLDELGKDNAIDMISSGIAEVITTAKEMGITLILENHGNIPVTSADMLKIIRKVNSPFLKLNFDIGNFLDISNENPMDAAKELYQYVDHIHAKDLAIAGKEDMKYSACIAGEGIVPLKECLQFFEQKKYNGYVSLEYEAWDIYGSKYGVPRSIAYLKSILP